jgi:hypothetical protein
LGNKTLQLEIPANCCVAGRRHNAGVDMSQIEIGAPRGGVAGSLGC